MKKLVTIVLALIITAMFASSALAADGITEDESSLYNKIIASVTSMSDLLGDELAASYIVHAENVLLQMDFTAEDCTYLSRQIDLINAELTGITTREELKEVSGKILAMVRAAVEPYWITLSLSAEGIVSVSIPASSGAAVIDIEDNGVPGGSYTQTPPKTGGDYEVVPQQVAPKTGGDMGSTTVATTGGLVRQTGSGTLQTVVILAVFAVVLGGAFIVIRKKHLLDRN